MPRMAGVAGDSIVDGPGIRTTYFFQGCPHHCPGCHNPETWAPDGGQEQTVEELAAMAEHNPLCRGVTLSGGEPFAQAEEAAALARLLKAAGFEVACYTGYTFEELLADGTPGQRALLAQLDVLIDGPYVAAQRSLELQFRGSANQRILNVPASLATGRGVEETSTRWTEGY